MRIMSKHMKYHIVITWSINKSFEPRKNIISTIGQDITSRISRLASRQVTHPCNTPAHACLTLQFYGCVTKRQLTLVTLLANLILLSLSTYTTIYHKLRCYNHSLSQNAVSSMFVTHVSMFPHRAPRSLDLNLIQIVAP